MAYEPPGDIILQSHLKAVKEKKGGRMFLHRHPELDSGSTQGSTLPPTGDAESPKPGISRLCETDFKGGANAETTLSWKWVKMGG